jgi:hypothetical protein
MPYNHPYELLAQDTRLTHAEVLAAAGKLPEARRMLAMAEESIERDGLAASGEVLRRVRAVYATLGQESRASELLAAARASELLAAAVAADQRALEVTTGGDERAQLLFSLARTLAAQGSPGEAATTATTAHRTAVSAIIRAEIERWLSELHDDRSAR